MKQTVDVAAYIWPAYTGKEPRTRIFWPEGIGEWETVQKAVSKCDEHVWPRKPLLGYQEEADPKVMEQQIELALSHGVNTFIYDWYWYDGRPFLEQCLNEGFLKARNCEDMKFYLMWANHSANYLWDRRGASADYRYTVIWEGKTDTVNYRAIAKHWFEDYFTRPNYYKIDGAPILSIYDLKNFIATFGTVAATKEMMLWLKEEAKNYGLPTVHFQFVHQGKVTNNLSGVDGGNFTEDILFELPFDSVTHYQVVHITDVNRDFGEIMADVTAEWERLSKKLPIPYFPHVSIGWDNNPRHSVLRPNIMKNNTPEAFRGAMAQAKEFAMRNEVKLITVNSWNEWTEGSYLLPDDLNGYGYLEAIRDVVSKQDK